jgi:hypothetical protein
MGTLHRMIMRDYFCNRIIIQERKISKLRNFHDFAKVVESNVFLIYNRYNLSAINKKFVVSGENHANS